MDSIMLVWIIPLSGLAGTCIGWLVKQRQYRREIKRQATVDASQTLKDKKKLLEECLANTKNENQKNDLQRQLDDTNAALLGLHTVRIKRTLDEAGLPSEEILISEGKDKLQPQQVEQIKKEADEIKRLPQSDSIDDLMAQASAYYYSEQYTDAIDVLNRIINLEPDNFIALNNRGITYHDLERYDEALDNYNKALEIKPDYTEILYNRGSTYGKLERYDEALADFNKALELKPDDPSAIYNIACVFSLQGKADDAISYLEKAIKLENKYKEDAKTDKDFDNIRDDPRFKKLIGEDQ